MSDEEIDSLNLDEKQKMYDDLHGPHFLLDNGYCAICGSKNIATVGGDIPGIIGSTENTGLRNLSGCRSFEYDALRNSVTNDPKAWEEWVGKKKQKPNQRLREFWIPLFTRLKGLFRTSNEESNND